MSDKKFDQRQYIEDWKRENMKSISLRYNKDFVEEFRAACDHLGLIQSQVIKKAMQEVIDRYKEEKR